MALIHLPSRVVADIEHREVPPDWEQIFAYDDDGRVEFFRAPAESPTAAESMFIHGWGLSPRSYRPAIQALQQHGQTVFAPSLPGFGESTSPADVHDFIHTAAERIVHGWEYIDAPAPLPVVAHSLGSAIAVDIAARHPGMISRLTLVSPVGGLENVALSWATLLSSVRHEFVLPNIGRVRDVLPNLVRNPAVIASSAAAAKSARLRGTLDALANQGLPIRLIVADHDGVAPAGALMEYTTHDHIEVVVVPGTHAWLLHEPETFAAITLDHSLNQ